MTEPKPRAWRAWLLLALACWLPLAQAAALVPSRAPAREENAYRGFCDETPDLRALARAASREAASGNVACGYENRLGPNCCGEQWDADLGLYFLRARYLNPDSGRFWNMDTYEGSVGDPITLHKYLYASANPVTFVDPSGHLSLMEVMTAFTVKAILVRMAVGATIGAVDSALSGRNILVGAAWGAGIGAIAPAIPWQIGLPLAGLGIADAALEGDWDTFALRVGVMAIGFGLSSYAQGQVGGRWGSFSTRLQDSRLALWLMRRGFSISNGGGQGAQEYIPPAPGRPSRTFVDITAKRGSTTVRIQTVTVNKNGTPIPEEVAAAARIKHAFPGDELILIAKTEQGVVLLPVADAPGGGASGDSTEE